MTYSFGTDYGKDVLVDLNQLAHTAGTDAIRRDCFQRAYKEIVRLRRVADTDTPELKEQDAKIERLRAALKEHAVEYLVGANTVEEKYAIVRKELRRRIDRAAEVVHQQPREKP